MQKKVFGRTGAELSILGFGCMRLPVLNPKDPTTIDYDLGTAMVRKAIDRGVNYVDTAWPYHSNSRENPGTSELFVAQALKDGYREKVHLATKLPTWLVTSRQDMDKYLDAQLQRLGGGHIDFYLAHNLNTLVWPKIKHLGLLEFLDEALKDGRIKYAGFSFHDRYEVFEDVVGSYDWTFGQIQYNYLDVDYQAGRRGLKLGADRGLAMVIMEPLRGGFLVNYLPEEMRAELAGIRPDWSPVDWGLRWLWDQPEVSLVLSGMTAMAHVDENLKIAETAAPLSEREQAAVGRVRDFFLKRIKVNCTGCGYCLPCPSGVNIPKNLSYYNNYHLIDADEARARVKYFYDAQTSPDETAANCVHCGECEDKCPQKLPISDTMTMVEQAFG